MHHGSTSRRAADEVSLLQFQTSAGDALGDDLIMAEPPPVIIGHMPVGAGDANDEARVCGGKERACLGILWWRRIGIKGGLGFLAHAMHQVVVRQVIEQGEQFRAMFAARQHGLRLGNGLFAPGNALFVRRILA